MTHYQLVANNKLKSWIIIIGFLVFVVGASYVMAEGFGFGLDLVGLALIFSGAMSFASYWWSDKIILKLSNAKEASREEFFDFYTVAENITAGQRMPMPKLYVIEDPAMNAFATGRDPEHAVVVATTGLLARLERPEIEGVVAHELAHVRNYDIRLMSIVTILVGFIALLADWMLRASFFGGGRKRENSGGGQLAMIMMVAGLVLAILSPFIAKIIQLAVSRRREFLADASGAGMTRNPEGLARALEKISADHQPLKAANKATAHLYISDPLKDAKGAAHWFAGLFKTHPPAEERIRALRSMTGTQ